MSAPTLDRTKVDTGTEELLAERDGNILIITFNRPERMNAISGPMLAAFSRILTEANRDTGVRVVIVTGRGRGFCAGLDLVESGPNSIAARSKNAQQLFDLAGSPPVVLYNMD